MLTDITGNIGFVIVFCTIFMGIGAYKFITKQNSDQLKVLGDKIDDFRMDTKIEQVKMQGNFEHMNEKQNRIESDTGTTRVQVSALSESVAKIQVRLQNIERESQKNENSYQN